MIARNRGERSGPLIDLWRLDELRAVSVEDGLVRVGALVTYTRVIEELGDSLPGLAAGARTIASRQVRNRATLGGALAVADPSADALAPLVAADAEVELAGPDGPRRLPVERFLTGPYTCDLRAGELVSAVLVAAARGPVAYAKVGARNAMARAACAVAITLDPARRAIGICVAAAGPTPLRARSAERLVAAEWPAAPDEDWLSRVGAAAAGDTRPRSDGRGSADYKRHAAAVLTRRALGRALAEAA